MSDGDVFTRKVTFIWRPVVEALRDDLSASECARRVETSLAKDLKRIEGMNSQELQQLLGTSTKSLGEDDIVRALEELVRRRSFERVVPPLLAEGQRFTSYRQAEAFTQLCLQSAQLKPIARSLLSRPDAKTLSRPARKQASTADLLNEAAPLGGKA